MSETGIILTDGAWGTQMQERGLGPDELPDLWNLTHPERVEEVARLYVQAGSQVILTNTFRANRIVVSSRDPGVDVAAINRAGVEISRRAAAGKARVFASIGPSGKLLMTGDVTEEELRSAFAEQARALAEAGADAIVIETMSDLAEAKIALEAAKATGLMTVTCMVYDSGKNKDRTMMGVTPEQAAEELGAAGADVIGANCGNGIAGDSRGWRMAKWSTIPLPENSQALYPGSWRREPLTLVVAAGLLRNSSKRSRPPWRLSDFPLARRPDWGGGPSAERQSYDWTRTRVRSH